MRNIRYFIFAVALALTVSSNAQTPKISIPVKGLYPEGTAYYAKDKVFFVGSVIDGTIGKVDLQGNYRPFYSEKTLKSTYGMKVNAKQDRLWVCVSDANYSINSDASTFKQLGRVIALDLSSGKKVADINLSSLFPGKHFINDLALDDKGNIYVTDSFSPVIYKVDTQGKASIFVQSDLFKGEDIGLNGIAYSPQGFLLVDVDRDGALYKIDITDPQNIQKVKINQFFPGSDGLILQNNNTLALIQNQNSEKVFQLTTTDNWATAKVTAATAGAARLQQPSAGAMVDGNLYVLNSKINELSDPTKRPAVAFSLQLADFKPVP